MCKYFIERLGMVKIFTDVLNKLMLLWKIIYQNENDFFRQLAVHKVLAYSNILETIPVSLFSLKNLAELDLSNNVLCSIPDALGSELTNLTHLVLRNNVLTDTDFPKDMSGLAKSLKYLNLSGNNLTSIPPPLLQLTGNYLGHILSLHYFSSVPRGGAWGFQSAISFYIIK